MWAVQDTNQVSRIPAAPPELRGRGWWRKFMTSDPVPGANPAVRFGSRRGGGERQVPHRRSANRHAGGGRGGQGLSSLRPTGACLAWRWRPGSVGVPGTHLGVGCRPRVGAGVPAASGSRSWCRQLGGTVQRWRPAHGRWPGRCRAARRTVPAAPRSAGPGPGRAKSPPHQNIEHMFEVESGMLPMQPDRPLAHPAGTQ
jgi:hypothetical protein